MCLILSLLFLPQPCLRLMNKKTDSFLGFYGGRMDDLRGNTESRNLSHYSNKIHTSYFNGISEISTPFASLEERMRFSG